MIYQIWSTHVSEDKEVEPFDVQELRRTDRKTAENDADIIKSILFRKSWIQEI